MEQELEFIRLLAKDETSGEFKPAPVKEIIYRDEEGRFEVHTDGGSSKTILEIVIKYFDEHVGEGTEGQEIKS